ncbi:MAG: glycerate kinase, partial [Selenomonadaceae bacterium]|nr:glycerate kinase [Selenomonadaceae bacterium]
TLAIDTLGIKQKSVAGDGAAGGLGFAFRTFLNGELIKGIDLILDAVNFRDAVKGADVLITGEGRIDSQTAMGKAPIGAAKLAKSIEPRIVTAAVCGCVGEGAAAVHGSGIDAFFSILNRPSTLEDAMIKETAGKNLSLTVEELTRLIRAIKIEGR